MKKKKEYKYFNYPNQLTGLEQYYYYLLEFEIIPNHLPAEIVEKIFLTIARDYLEGFIDISAYETIMGNFYYRFAVGRTDIDRKLDYLMSESTDVIYYGESAIKEITEELRQYFSERNENK